MTLGSILLTVLLQTSTALQDTIAKIAQGAAGKAPKPDTTDPQQAIAELKSIDWPQVLQNLTDKAVDLTLRIVAALLVFYVGKFIIGRLVMIIKRSMTSRRVDLSLGSFLVSLTRITLMFLLVITCVGILGIETSSFIAIFASAGVAVGMALSGTLQNFAGGVLILLLKPYRVGDYITYESYSGYVREIQIFHTVITTYGNQRIVIPNGPLSTGIVKNVSAEPYVRVEWSLSLAYGDDIGKAREAILELIAADERIVYEYSHEELPPAPAIDEQTEAEQQKKPSLWRRIFGHAARIRERAAEAAMATVQKLPCKPSVNVSKLDDSSVSVVVRAWTRTSDYWAVYYELLETFYSELPKRGLNFPFPQIDVNFKKN